MSSPNCLQEISHARANAFICEQKWQADSSKINRKTRLSDIFRWIRTYPLTPDRLWSSKRKAAEIVPLSLYLCIKAITCFVRFGLLGFDNVSVATFASECWQGSEIHSSGHIFFLIWVLYHSSLSFFQVDAVWSNVGDVFLPKSQRIPNRLTSRAKLLFLKTYDVAMHMFEILMNSLTTIAK